jgi:RimJ/RimL family protein N-acetyltransferase
VRIFQAEFSLGDLFALSVNEESIRFEVADGFYLSPIVRADKAAYLEHFADPEIVRNLLAVPFPYTEADADRWLDRCEQFVGYPMTNFALRAPSDYLIGTTGIVGALSPDAHRAEFGYWLAQSYRGHGLTPRVIRTFSDYAFQHLRIHRLFATPFSSNLASHRALEKAGFERKSLLRHHHLKQGIYLDAIIYGRTSDSNGNA